MSIKEEDSENPKTFQEAVQWLSELHEREVAEARAVAEAALHLKKQLQPKPSLVSESTIGGEDSELNQAVAEERLSLSPPVRKRTQIEADEPTNQRDGSGNEARRSTFRLPRDGGSMRSSRYSDDKTLTSIIRLYHSVYHESNRSSRVSDMSYSLGAIGSAAISSQHVSELDFQNIDDITPDELAELMFTFHIRPCWNDDSQIAMLPTSSDLCEPDMMLKRNATRVSLVDTFLQKILKIDNSFDSDDRSKNNFMRPTTLWRVVWNIFGLLALLYDAVMLPLTVFELPPSQFTVILSWTVLIYWSVDIPSNFIKGYYDESGILILQYSKIFKHYLKSWLIVDVFLVFLDWFLMAFGFSRVSSSQTESSMNSLRFIFALRSLRLLRLMKAQDFIFYLQDHIMNITAFILLGTMKTLLWIMMVNHFIACLWYAMGAYQSNSSGWIEDAELPSDSWTMVYLTCYHWSLSQFGVGSSAVLPVTAGELLFSSFVLLYALIVFSSLVSSVVAASAQLRALHSDQMFNFLLLRRFCLKNGISNDLSQRMQRYLGFAVTQDSVRSGGLAFAHKQLLSESLRLELQLEIYFPHFKDHSLFRRLFRTSKQAMMNACHSCITESRQASGDVVFCEGQLARGLVVLLDGYFLYHHSSTFECTLPQDGMKLLSEPAIWTCWVHMGDLVSTQPSEVVLLDANKFAEAFVQYSKTFQYLSLHAAQVCFELGRTPLRELSDLPLPALANIARRTMRHRTWGDWGSRG